MTHVGQGHDGNMLVAVVSDVFINFVGNGQSIEFPAQGCDDLEFLS